MNGSNATSTLKRPLLVSATLVTVALTFAMPFLFHLLPSTGIPLGARLLPIFYAPFLAALFFPAVVPLSASVIAPFFNHFLTGSPPLPMAVQLSAELVVFTSVVLLLKRRWPRLPITAPLAYLVARVVIFFAGSPIAVSSSEAWTALFTSLQVALPGFGMLLLLNLVASFWQQRSRS